jgi:hypothetical protein
MSKPLEERFWKRVQLGTSRQCWEWAPWATKAKGNYGVFYPGKPHPNGFRVFAHRQSWELAHGKIPKGLCVCHKCDNPPCVNPNHLFLGSKSDNIIDMHEKGRANHVSGESHGCSKINSRTARKIKDMRANGNRIFEIAETLRLSRAIVSRVVNGINWKNI